MSDETLNQKMAEAAIKHATAGLTKKKKNDSREIDREKKQVEREIQTHVKKAQKTEEKVAHPEETAQNKAEEVIKRKKKQMVREAEKTVGIKKTPTKKTESTGVAGKVAKDVGEFEIAKEAVKVVKHVK